MTAFSVDIERIDDQPAWLGRNKVHDSRSREFDVVNELPDELVTVPRGVRLPKLPDRDIDHRPYIGPFDQGDVGCCTMCAGVMAMCAPPFPNLLRPTIRDVHALYSEETRLDESDIPGVWPPDDTGSTGLWSAKVLRRHGWIRGWAQAFSFEAAMAALVRGPVSIGTWWYDSMEQTDREGVLHVEPGAARIGGHQYLAVGREVARQRTRVRQSWGAKWGPLGGDFWINDDDLRGLLADGGDVTVFRR